MAINRLNSIVSQMKSLWSYGDKEFGYTFEVNEKHNTKYPYMMINPPNSEMPEIYGGWEAYDFEIDFFDTYKTANQNAVSLDEEWDNLQDFALEWFDKLMIHYNNPGGDNVGIYFLEESLTFERVKEVANDRLVQIKMFFTLRAVTRCMVGNIPMNYYPNQINNLLMWLSADSDIEYNTITGKVSRWLDKSGNNNNVHQINDSLRPKRVPYGGANNKTKISFSSNNAFETVANSPIGTDFTAFIVAKSKLASPVFTNKLSMHLQSAPDVVSIGNPQDAGGNNIYSFTDGAGNDQPFSVSLWANIDPTQNPRGFIDKNSTAAREYSFYSLVANGYVYVRIWSASGAYLQARVTQSAIASGGEWKHYAFTYNGSNLGTGIKIYINGIESQDNQITQVGYTGMVAGSDPLEIGNGNGNPYYGDLDEVSIYNKELTQAEITELYNKRAPTDINGSSVKNRCIGWWRMGDNTSVPTVPDKALATTSPNNGTMDASMSADNLRDFVPTHETSTYINYEIGNVELSIGSNSQRAYCLVRDSSQSVGEWNARYVWNANTSEHILTAVRLDSASEVLDLIGNTNKMTGVMDDYDHTQTYNSAKLQIGKGVKLGDLSGGEIQEIIIYDRAITDLEIERVKSYLNNKYKIY